MRKCLFFFLGLIAALGVAVLMGSDTGHANPPGLKATWGAASTQADGLESQPPQNQAAALKQIPAEP
jgi:hypothetical protein